MKKILALILAAALALSLVACGSDGTGDSNTPGGENTLPPATDKSVDNTKVIEETKYYQLGDTVSTDIFEFTLDRADLAIALVNTIGDNGFLPKEYDATTDSRNPYVAAKGHTLVAITYTAKNLDRASVEVDGGSNPTFITVEYDNQTYNSETIYGYSSVNGWDWEQDPSTNTLLLAGEHETRRCYLDIPVETEDLSDTFSLIFSIPNSEGKTEDFIFVVTAQDRENLPEKEVTINEAITKFTKETGQTYFAEHMEDYVPVSGSEMQGFLFGKTWTVNIKKSYGSWEGTFQFEEDGRIKDSYGYVNERTWEINGDILVLNGKKNCDMKLVSDGLYLLVCDGQPYMLMQ